MPLTTEEMIQNIQQRHNRFVGKGIALASDQLSFIRGSDSGLWSQKLSGKSWDSVVEDAQSKLVFTNGMVQKRQANAGLPTERTPDSIADIALIVTTSNEDRDGDLLEAKGAEIDPAAPLLWQHFWAEPIGKFVGILEQNRKRVRAHVAIANTMLGRDAATLAKFGALRVSHGFIPSDYEERKSSDGRSAFHVKKYKIIEISLVSIPSNVEAAIEAFVDEKLFHPGVRNWAKSLHDNRSKIYTVGSQGPTLISKTETVGDTSHTTTIKTYSSISDLNHIIAGVGLGQTEKEIKPEVEIKKVVDSVIETTTEKNLSATELAIQLLLKDTKEVPYHISKSLVKAFSESIREQEDQQLAAALAD